MVDKAVDELRVVGVLERIDQAARVEMVEVLRLRCFLFLDCLLGQQSFPYPPYRRVHKEGEVPKDVERHQDREESGQQKHEVTLLRVVVGRTEVRVNEGDLGKDEGQQVEHGAIVVELLLEQRPAHSEAEESEKDCGDQAVGVLEGRQAGKSRPAHYAQTVVGQLESD